MTYASKFELDYEKLGDEILNFDMSIRFVEIHYNGKKYRKLSQGLKSFLNPEETDRSINDAILRWKTRLVLSHKIGDPAYSMTEYKKVKRVTIPFNKGGLILVSFEPKGYHEIIIKKIIEIADRYTSDFLLR